jgi:imidazolonepropionase-like amidohydrolase
MTLSSQVSIYGNYCLVGLNAMRETMPMSFCVMLLLAFFLPAEKGEFTIHLILHAVGHERYEVSRTNNEADLHTTLEYTDRANVRTSSATLRMRTDYTPIDFTLTGKPDFARVERATATVQQNGVSRTFALPARYFTSFGLSPFAVQSMMFRYWMSHGKPADLPILSASAKAEPVHISLVGHDSVDVNGKRLQLGRYTVSNLAFGSEVLWADGKGEVVAIMTFAGGLPMEAVRTEYEPLFPQLYRSGVAQQREDLRALAREVPPERNGTFAISGATLVDGTGAAPLAPSTVLIRNGKISAVGRSDSVTIPHGTPVFDAGGETLLPGLWEMHIHASGVEFGPALLAAGITTARDCGGEFDYLVAQRRLAAKNIVPSPRMLLAGLIDAGGINAFGAVTAETPEEARAVVGRYHAAGFEQIKLYTYLKPDVIRAVASEAHRLGMTVTGHVPKAVTTMGGIEDGMDQINHLNYVSSMMRKPNEPSDAIDMTSPTAQGAIAFLKAHATVIDPTIGWGEMASHSKEVDVASFEPGILHAPFVLEAKFKGMGSASTATQMEERLRRNLQVVQALHRAGVPIVPGSDTGLPGYGLLRELELYVEAGFTPLEAIQSATIVAARAMNLGNELGTVEVGKRADLILVDGDPLANISNLRKVSRVITGGRMYQTSRLWKSVGFQN